jgi:hypothetical protein
MHLILFIGKKLVLSNDPTEQLLPHFFFHPRKETGPVSETSCGFNILNDELGAGIQSSRLKKQLLELFGKWRGYSY